MLTVQNNALYCEDISLADIAARYGTPCYVYSKKTILDNVAAYQKAFSAQTTMLHFAVKANTHLKILSLLNEAGCGFDVVSGGELAALQKIEVDPARIIFSGVGKTDEEIHAALAAGIHCFTSESESELIQLQAAAEAQNRIVPIALRVNFDIDPKTHRHISTGQKNHKFGIPVDEAKRLYAQLKTNPHFKIMGVACHLGSQITTATPFEHAVTAMRDFVKECEKNGILFSQINLGGGLGIAYHPYDTVLTPEDLFKILSPTLAQIQLPLILEPGRSLVGNAGTLITRIVHTKMQGDTAFAIVDAGMNDCIRPALYDAHHTILPVNVKKDASYTQWIIAGPICESSDNLGKAELSSPERGDLLALCDAGAYGFVMSSQYNSRRRPAAVLVEGNSTQLIRTRETFEDLFSHEQF